MVAPELTGETLEPRQTQDSAQPKGKRYTSAGVLDRCRTLMIKDVKWRQCRSVSVPIATEQGIESYGRLRRNSSGCVVVWILEAGLQCYYC